jgi:hypothetical protein
VAIRLSPEEPNVEAMDPIQNQRTREKRDTAVAKARPGLPEPWLGCRSADMRTVLSTDLRPIAYQ